jgi:hypothetical protein
MAHIPINHHFQPLFRALAGLCGLYVLVFGIVGFVETSDLDFFAQDGLPWVLGLKANAAFAVLSIVAGAVVVVANVIGRNVARWVNLIAGIVFLVAGMAMLIVLRTDLNILGFTMTTCIVSFILGIVFFIAGLYGRTGTTTEALREEQFRHGVTADPQEHPWTPDLGPKPASQTQDHRFA